MLVNLKMQNVQRQSRKKTCGSVYLFLIAILGLPICASAGASDAPAVLRPLSFTARGSSVLSDLDGDHQADLATIEPDAFIQGGYRYRVDVSLTGQLPSTFYVDAALFKGLRIIARDVDGDDDLDLVVTSRFQELIGIWVNDGRGQFTRKVVAGHPPLWNPTSCNFEAPDGLVHPVVLAGSSSSLSNGPHPVFWFGLEFSPVSGFRDAPRAARLNPGSSLRAPPRR